jgi:hypothetical protein
VPSPVVVAGGRQSTPTQPESSSLLQARRKRKKKRIKSFLDMPQSFGATRNDRMFDIVFISKFLINLRISMLT